jgi:hypothetical protein
MGPDSDGFVMTRFGEGALGDPVLAGNLVFSRDGRRRQSLQGLVGSWGKANYGQQNGPRPSKLGPRRWCNAIGPPVSYIAVLKLLDSVAMGTAHVWDTPGKGFFQRGICGH